MSGHVLHGHIVTENNVLENHYLTIENGIIASISNKEPQGVYEKIEVADGSLFLPGFRDQHTHDVNGQLAAQNQDEEEIANRFATVMNAYAANGVTAVYVATFGAPLELLEHYCRGAKRWIENEQNGKNGTKLTGINIEGSFINEECRGAQSAEYCFMPHRMDCIAAVDHLHQTGAVKMMNIVPDYGEPSLAVIKHAHDLGIMAGSGHTKPEAQQLQRAFHECGLQYMVHFTNGPMGQSFKPFGGGNAFEGAMTIPIVKEMIVDLIHIDGRYVLDMIHRSDERWGEDAVIAITDACFPFDNEVPGGEFQIGTTMAKKDHEMNCLRAAAYIQADGSLVPAPPNTLCGSIVKMNQVFANLVELFTSEMDGIWYHHPARTQEFALVKAAKLCAASQAKLDGSFAWNGSLATGKQADITIGKLQTNHNRFIFEIQQTLVNGETVYTNA